jgi:hypothetical protein
MQYIPYELALCPPFPLSHTLLNTWRIQYANYFSNSFMVLCTEKYTCGTESSFKSKSGVWPFTPAVMLLEHLFPMFEHNFSL